MLLFGGYLYFRYIHLDSDNIRFNLCLVIPAVTRDPDLDTEPKELTEMTPQTTKIIEGHRETKSTRNKGKILLPPKWSTTLRKNLTSNTTSGTTIFGFTIQKKPKIL